MWAQRKWAWLCELSDNWELHTTTHQLPWNDIQSHISRPSLYVMINTHRMQQPSNRSSQCFVTCEEHSTYCTQHAWQPGRPSTAFLSLRNMEQRHVWEGFVHASWTYRLMSNCMVKNNKHVIWRLLIRKQLVNSGPGNSWQRRKNGGAQAPTCASLIG